MAEQRSRKKGGRRQRSEAGSRRRGGHGQRGNREPTPPPALREGMIRVTSRGTGYVRVEGFDEDVEVRDRNLNTALDRDTVRVALHARRKNERMTGEVVAILARARTRFTGLLEHDQGLWYLIPDDRKVYADLVVTDEGGLEPVAGHKAVVELIGWKAGKNPEGKLCEILGVAGSHETEMRAIIATQGFDWRYPEAAEREAKGLSQDRAARFAHEAATRRDMRDVPTFTVDPADAKDFDDAISLRMLESGSYELGIHIADVSAYVPKGGAIDEEAQHRATSIYLVDRTIPMLPEVLSNDLCSLVPGEERLACSAIFTVTREGEVLERWFGETIIKSAMRFSYEDAQKLLEKTRSAPQHPEPLGAELVAAAEIAARLRTARFKNGSIAFDTDEVKFELDAEGKPVRAYRKVLLETNHMIEDLMLLANREVARFVSDKSAKSGAPFIYRTHDTPKRDRIEELALYLKMLGYELSHKEGMVTAPAINALFEQIEGKPEQDMVETAVIRSMAKAVYSTKNIGHFGLAFDFYTHFTSPIRRYPDLVVHRTLKAHLAGSPPTTRDQAYYERVATHASEREVAAMEAERDSIKLKQCEFLSTKIGETFSGIVTGIAEWGVFVEELETKAEGLIRISTLRDDIYTLTDHGFRLSASITDKGFSIGDRVTVTLAHVDVEHRLIDWSLTAPTPTPAP